MLNGLRNTNLTEQYLDITGSIFGVNTISGLNIFTAGSQVAAVQANANGRIDTISLGSATTQVYGLSIQVGSVTTTAGAFGSALFARPFANTQYVFFAQAGSTGTRTIGDMISGIAVVSGANGKNVSGVVFAGAASMYYDWVAIGAI